MERDPRYHFRPRTISDVVVELITVATVVTAIGFLLWMSTLRG